MYILAHVYLGQSGVARGVGEITTSKLPPENLFIPVTVNMLRLYTSLTPIRAVKPFGNSNIV